MKKGLLMVYTGNGKGKTTSALGMAMRSAGHGFKVCIVQFIKTKGKYGELEACKRFSDEIDIRVMGRGFTFRSDDLEKDRAKAREAWAFSREAIAGGAYHLVILDEFTYLLNYGMIDMENALDVFAHKPDSLHVAITGRDAPRPIIDAADLVTDMREVKHPFKDAGIIGQRGIEF